MTNSEAIAILKATVPNRINGDAFDLAIKALEKQIPKKPSRTREPFADALLCPYCHSVLSPRNKIMYMDNYCHKCGQAIDWEDEE